MSIADAIERVSTQRIEPFVAPILPGQREVLTVQNNTPYWLRLWSVVPGWHLLTTEDRIRTTSEREAYPHEYLGYLEQLPRWLVIALFPLDDTRWLCVPFHQGDADQRGWARGEPRQLHLVRHNIQARTIIIARQLGDVLIEEHLALTYIGNAPNLANATSLVVEHEMRIQRAQELERQLQLRAQKARIMEAAHISQGEQFGSMLSYSSAQMVGWKALGNNFEVEYEFDGARHTVEVKQSGQVVSAGICLSNTDRTHTLTSIVPVMQRARVLNRFDMDRRLWK